MSSPDKSTIAIVGVDLAWGNRNPDGFCISWFGDGLDEIPSILSCGTASDDVDLFEWINVVSSADQILVMVDAPLICVNEHGMRPVDRECNRLYRKFEAGCHPVNLNLCSRPLQVAEHLRRLDFAITADLGKSNRIATEVYPHPAMIRLFGLEKTIKYKRGLVATKRKEFSRYQDHLGAFLQREIPWFGDRANFGSVLTDSWTKPNEDKLDAVLCFLIGYWHLKYNGERSEILGDDETGHMLIPKV